MNEITVKINKNRLPSISLKYEEDLRKANLIINEINCLLEATPLDVARLNEKLKEAIDFVYTLFNSVNNLVGMQSWLKIPLSSGQSLSFHLS